MDAALVMKKREKILMAFLTTLYDIVFLRFMMAVSTRISLSVFGMVECYVAFC